MFELSLQKSRDRVLALLPSHLEVGERPEAIAQGSEDLHAVRWMFVAAVALFPVLFLMELREVSGILQAVTLGVVFGVVNFAQQVRHGRWLVLTDRRLLLFGVTWLLRPGALLRVLLRSAIGLVRSEDASFGTRMLTLSEPGGVEHDFRIPRPWREDAAAIESQFAHGPILPPPPPSGA